MSELRTVQGQIWKAASTSVADQTLALKAISAVNKMRILPLASQTVTIFSMRC